MPEICTRNIPKMYQRYTRDVPEIYQRCTIDIPEIYQKYTWDIPGIHERYSRYTPDIHQRNTWDIVLKLRFSLGSYKETSYQKFVWSMTWHFTFSSHAFCLNGSISHSYLSLCASSYWNTQKPKSTGFTLQLGK